MNDLLRSFGRALASVLHPRMLWLTLAPFLAAAVVWGAILWFSWQTLIGATRGWLDSWSFTTTLYHLFDWAGFSSLHAVVAPFIVVAIAIPLIVVTLGLFILVVNGLMLWLTGSLSQSLGLGFHVTGFWSAFFGAIVYSVISWLLSHFLLHERRLPPRPR